MLQKILETPLSSELEREADQVALVFLAQVKYN